MATKPVVYAEIWRATFSTMRADFIAYGTDRNNAYALLTQAWEDYCECSTQNPGHLKRYAEEVAYEVVHPGEVYLDGQRVV